MVGLGWTFYLLERDREKIVVDDLESETGSVLCVRIIDQDLSWLSMIITSLLIRVVLKNSENSNPELV